MNENILEIQGLIEELTLVSKGQSTKFSGEDMESKLRDKMSELFGVEKPDFLDIQASPNKGLFYKFVGVALGDVSSDNLAKALPFAEVIDTEWGDVNEFFIENVDLYDIVTVAKGNGNTRRQRLVDGRLVVPTEACSIKIYAPFKQFLAGRINWSKMLTKMSDSYIKHIRELTYLAFYNSTPVGGNSAFNVNIAGPFDIEKAYELVDHVQAENMDSNVVIVGSRQSLRKFTPIVSTEQANKDMYESGIYKSAEGYTLVALDQMHIKSTYNFLLSNKQVMIIPADLGSIVKIVQEGKPIVTSNNIGDNADFSIEHMFYREVGVSVVTGAKYGKLTWAS